MVRLSPLPTDVHFDVDADAFAFKAVINGKSVQCFISSPVVEAHLGKRASLKDTIVSIERSTLVDVAKGLAERETTEPVWIAVEALEQPGVPQPA